MPLYHKNGQKVFHELDSTQLVSQPFLLIHHASLCALITLYHLNYEISSSNYHFCLKGLLSGVPCYLPHFSFSPSLLCLQLDIHYHLRLSDSAQMLWEHFPEPLSLPQLSWILFFFSFNTNYPCHSFLLFHLAYQFLRAEILGYSSLNFQYLAQLLVQSRCLIMMI